MRLRTRRKWVDLPVVPFPVGARRFENSGLEMRRGETAHSCKKALQALLGFSITLLGATSLDDGIVCRIYLCGWGDIFAPSSGRGRLTITDHSVYPMDFRRDKNLIIPKKRAKNKSAINLKITTYNIQDQTTGLRGKIWGVRKCQRSNRTSLKLARWGNTEKTW